MESDFQTREVCHTFVKAIDAVLPVGWYADINQQLKRSRCLYIKQAIFGATNNIMCIFDVDELDDFSEAALAAATEFGQTQDSDLFIARMTLQGWNVR